jgi:hypothetical protein
MSNLRIVAVWLGLALVSWAVLIGIAAIVWRLVASL